MKIHTLVVLPAVYFPDIHYHKRNPASLSNKDSYAPMMTRIYRRVQLDHPALVIVNPTQQGEKIFLVRAVDISASGAKFRSKDHFSPGTPVKMVFILKEGHSQNKILKIKFTGIVIRCEPGGIAVAFDEVHPIILSPERATIKTPE